MENELAIGIQINYQEYGGEQFVLLKVSDNQFDVFASIYICYFVQAHADLVQENNAKTDNTLTESIVVLCL